MNYYEEEKRAHELFSEKKYKEVVDIYEAILKDPNSTEIQRVSFFIKETDNYYEHLSSIPNAPVYFNCACAYSHLGNYDKVNEMLTELNKLNWMFWRLICSDKDLESFRQNATNAYIILLGKSNDTKDFGSLSVAHVDLQSNTMMHELSRYNVTIYPNGEEDD